eukprot:5287033-Ditylum_brightwellii.AAC.1
MHFGRCSGTVALADVGISMPNLKRAGRWVSISVVEQYMEHSHASKTKRVALLNKHKKVQQQQRKRDGSNYSSSNSSSSDNNDSSKTDQKVPATMNSSKNKQT